jgi:hypothetical protein
VNESWARDADASGPGLNGVRPAMFMRMSIHFISKRDVTCRHFSFGAASGQAPRAVWSFGNGLGGLAVRR